MRRNRKELCIFFIITMIVTWVLWLPSVLAARDIDVPVILLIISMMASFTPTITGLILHRKYLGKDHFKTDMKARLSLKFSKAWLIGVPVFFFGTALISLVLMKLMVSDFEATNTVPWVMTPLVFLQILFIGGALGEEFGWRGFAQARLQKVFSPMVSAFILGLIWSLWHLPLFFMEGTVQSSMPIWQFMLQNTLLAFFYTWLYEKTKGNLWMMIYLHAVANTAAAIVPYWQNDTGRFIGLGILVISVFIFYIVSPISDLKGLQKTT